MFMGSRHAPYPAFDAIMESWGGHNNGTTSNDRTNYYEIGPRNLLETFLWLEADRLATLPDVITAEELEKQRKVVSERAPPVLREPPLRPRRAGHSGGDVPAPTIPTTGRPSARTPISRRPPSTTCARSSIASIDPSNASLVVAGDFDPAARRARSSTVTSAGSRSASRRSAPPHPATPQPGGRRRDDADRPGAAAAAAARLAHAGAVRAGRRRSRSGGARAGRRQVEPPLPRAGLREANRPGRLRLPGVADAQQRLPHRRHRQTGP